MLTNTDWIQLMVAGTKLQGIGENAAVGTTINMIDLNPLRDYQQQLGQLTQHNGYYGCCGWPYSYGCRCTGTVISGSSSPNVSTVLEALKQYAPEDLAKLSQAIPNELRRRIAELDSKHEAACAALQQIDAKEDTK